MSEPMRFNLKHFGQISTMEVAKDGEFVLHSDYARLKAEVERLRASSFVTAVPSEDYEKLKAENEKLKAELERLNDLANNPYRLSKGWQPIETAPMDGTDILCFCVEPEFEGEENPWTEFRVCFYGVLTEGESCWMSHYGYEQRPTHWMPLPKPPTAKDGKPSA